MPRTSSARNQSGRHRGKTTTLRRNSAAASQIGAAPAVPNGAHRAPRQKRRSRQIQPTATVVSALAVTGVVAAFSLNSAAQPSSDDVLPSRALGDSRSDVSRGQGRLPLLETGGEAAKAGAATSRAARAERRAAEAKAKRERQEKARKARIANAINNPRAVAEDMLADYGWGPEQMSCLDSLWQGESNWDHRATNPSSGAYGIPQSLPAGKMASAGSDWRTNPITQISWGLGYIEDVYGDPCSANAFKSGNNWY